MINPALKWLILILYECVCVHACIRACVQACVHACMHVRVCAAILYCHQSVTIIITSISLNIHGTSMHGISSMGGHNHLGLH